MELPNPLPPGAHRVISEMTAAQMRKMMEGVVLYGTGKQAQLNGYSSGGKTGTAQKIDPLTRILFKDHAHRFVRWHCAGEQSGHRRGRRSSIIPKALSYYGAAVSAPVFQEVAQQVLEYLGVPHDIEVRAPATKKSAETDIAEDDSIRQRRRRQQRSMPQSTTCPLTIHCAKRRRKVLPQRRPRTCPATKAAILPSRPGGKGQNRKTLGSRRC